jgi:hypothetical protein
MTYLAIVGMLHTVQKELQLVVRGGTRHRKASEDVSILFRLQEMVSLQKDLKKIRTI